MIGAGIGLTTVLMVGAAFAVACSSGDSMGSMEASATPTARAAPMEGMTGMPSSGDLAPAVRGFAKGGTVVFIHTEASDPDVAGMLTQMMGPRVVLVPALAQAPAELLANVFVFTNGVRGDGPFGYQPDVFDAVPGDPGYRPLRAILLVTWQEGVSARELRSVEQIREAEARGEIKVERLGIVVNMPILTWPGGQR